MHTWTRDILFKHGHHVQSMAFKIVSEWLNLAPPQITEINNNDNLQHGGRKRRGLSYESTVEVLTMCPNLRSLEITIPKMDSDLDLSIFYTRLGEILEHLPTLRHLTIDNSTSKTAPAELVAQIIEMLPILETFKCSNLTTQTLSNQSISTGILGPELAQLKGLSKLDLCNCEAVAATWCYRPWAATLTHLTLLDCPNLLIPDAQHLIEQFASSLTDLKLWVPESPLPYEWIVEHKFQLPVLRVLELAAPKAPKLLESFQDCKALQHISWCLMAPSEWPVLQHLVMPVPTWPNLKSLEAIRAEPHDRGSWEYNLGLFELRKFCHHNNITFHYSGMDIF